MDCMSCGGANAERYALGFRKRTGEHVESVVALCEECRADHCAVGWIDSVTPEPGDVSTTR